MNCFFLLFDFSSQLFVKLEKLLNFAVKYPCVLSCILFITFFSQFFGDGTHIDLFGKGIYFLLKFNESVMFSFHLLKFFFRTFNSTFKVHIVHELFDDFGHNIACLSSIHFRHGFLIFFVFIFLNKQKNTFSIAMSIFSSFPISFSCNLTSSPI